MYVNTPTWSIPFHSLAPGESVEVFDWKNVFQCRGVIQETALELGVAWIRTDIGERRLVDIHEHLVRRCPPPPSWGR